MTIQQRLQPPSSPYLVYEVDSEWNLTSGAIGGANDQDQATRIMVYLATNRMALTFVIVEDSTSTIVAFVRS